MTEADQHRPRTIRMSETYSPTFPPTPQPHVSTGQLDMQYWTRLHVPGAPNVFRVRGPNYLRDRVKIPAGNSKFWVASMDMVSFEKPVEHVAR